MSMDMKGEASRSGLVNQLRRNRPQRVYHSPEQWVQWNHTFDSEFSGSQC